VTAVGRAQIDSGAERRDEAKGQIEHGRSTRIDDSRRFGAELSISLRFGAATA
jgi:hypothetical protein